MANLYLDERPVSLDPSISSSSLIRIPLRLLRQLMKEMYTFFLEASSIV